MFVQAHMPQVAARFVETIPLQRSIPARADESTRLVGRITSFAGGDERALAEFYTATVVRAYALALQLHGDALRAEAAVEDAYVRAWDSARKAAPAGHPMAWLLTHVREAASVGAGAQLPDLLALTDPPSAVHQALQRLAETQRQALCAALLHAGDIELVAKALAVASRTAKARLRAGIRVLASELRA